MIFFQLLKVNPKNMSIVISDLAPKLSTSLKQNPKYASMIVGRTTRSFTTQADVFSPNGLSQINIKIPSCGFIDGSTLYFTGVLQFTQGLRLTKSLNSLFSRYTIRTQSGDVIADVNGFNVLSSALGDFSLTSVEADSAFAITQLTGSDQYREQICTGVRFAFQLNTAIFRVQNLLPMHLLGGCELTLFLEDTKTAFIKVDQSLTSSTYQISNFSVVVDVCTVAPAVEQLFEQAYNADKLSWNLTTFTHYPFQSNSIVDSFRIEPVNNSNRSLICIPRLVSRLLDPNGDSFERTAQSLRYCQFSIGSNLLKRFEASGGGAELFMQIQKALDFSNTGQVNAYNFHNDMPNLTAAQQAVRSSKFMIGLSTELSLWDDSILSGSSKMPITMTLEYGNAIAPTQYDCYILSDLQLVCGASIGTRVLV